MQFRLKSLAKNLVCGLIAASLVGGAFAAPGDGGRGPNQGPGQNAPQQHNGQRNGRNDGRDFSNRDARQMAVKYRYTGYSALPNNVRHNMVQGKPLPQGVSRQPVPPRMRGHLPAREGHEWYRAGNDLVLVAVTTGVVATVMSNVFR